MNNEDKYLETPKEFRARMHYRRQKEEKKDAIRRRENEAN